MGDMYNNWRVWAAAATFFALALFVQGCRSQGADLPKSGGSHQSGDTTALEEMLRAELMKKLIDLGKIDPATGEVRTVSGPPSGDLNRPQLLQAVTQSDASLRLRFIERLSGDYDLTGSVGVPDITPIALNYLSEVSWDAQGNPSSGEENERLAVIDGDKNGSIGISDITQIALNYLTTLSGYNLYRDGEPIPGAGGAPTMPRPSPGENGWRDGRWPMYEFTDNPGGGARSVAYTLRPVDADGIEGEGNDFIVSYNPASPLAAPTGLAAAPGDSQVSLDWNDNTEQNLAGYNVYVSTIPDVAPPAPVNAEPIAVSEFVVTELENATLYYFWATAVSTDSPPQESAFSSRAEATPEEFYSPPAMPTGLAATPGNGIVELVWDSNSEPDLAGYLVYRSTFPEDTSPLLLTPDAIPETNFTADGLTNDVEYFFWVSAVDVQEPPGESEKAGPVSATPSSALNMPPVAVAGASPQSGFEPLEVGFDADGSHDPDGTIVLYRWDFDGDGEWDFESALGGNADHTYRAAGQFVAKLEVTDDLGAMDEDTVTITVSEQTGEWTTIIVHSIVPVHDLGLAHYAEGAAGIVVSEETGGARPLHFFRVEGGVEKDTISDSGGGDAIDIDITAEGGVFVGHARYNEMFEDSGYLHFNVGGGWEEYSIGTIWDGTRVLVGASHESVASAGFFPLGEDSYILLYDVAGEQAKTATGIFRPRVVNPAMKSNGVGACWLKDESGMEGYIAELSGNTWMIERATELDETKIEYFFRADFALNLGMFVFTGSEGSDSQGLVRYMYDGGGGYTYDNTRFATWLGEKKGVAIGPDGEVYYWYIDSRDGALTIQFYFDDRNNYDSLPLEGPIAGGRVAHAKMDVRNDGIPAIVYQLEESTVIYYATFPRPPMD